MSVILFPEESIGAALRQYQVDPGVFEAGVRARLAKAADERESAVELSPALRAVASLLPAGFLQPAALGGAVKVAPASGIAKLVGYAAFPAISLFLLAGAAFFSVVAIRKTRAEAGAGPSDEPASQEIALQWWRDHRWGAKLVFAASLAMAFFGATWLLFLFYIASFGVLLYVLKSLARVGLTSQASIGSYCIMGLGLLGQLAGFPGIGAGDIHLLDQHVVILVFFWGAFGLTLLLAIRGGRPRYGGRWFPAICLLIILVPMTAWFTNQLYWPATPARIKAYVESFDRARFSSASWSEWEIPASWTVEAGMKPNWARPRRLLATELAGEQNGSILSDAFRVGVVQPKYLLQLRDYRKRLDRLLNHGRLQNAGPITSLQQNDWVIRAAVMSDDLTPEQKDYLAERLHLTLNRELTAELTDLEPVLRAVQLLQAIGRPVDAGEYRSQVHEFLRKHHTTAGGGFQLAGGFKRYAGNGRVLVGDLEATAYAVELMGVFGIPEGLDMDWVRSYLRPLSFRPSSNKWAAAVSLDRLHQLPGVTQPTWLEALYYERTLLAAAVLVGLCIYATVAFPSARTLEEMKEAGANHCLPD